MMLANWTVGAAKLLHPFGSSDLNQEMAFLQKSIERRVAADGISEQEALDITMFERMLGQVSAFLLALFSYGLLIFGTYKHWTWSESSMLLLGLFPTCMFIGANLFVKWYQRNI